MTNGKKRKATEQGALQEGRKLQAKSAPSRAEEDEAEEDEQPVKKKKKKKKQKGMPLGLLIGVGAGVLLLLIVGAAASAFFFTRPAPQGSRDGQLAQSRDKKENEKTKDGQPEAKPQPPVPQGVPIVPGIKEGNPATKPGGDNIVSNVRGAGYRTERRNELRQLGLAYVDFCDTNKGASRNMENFLKHINTFAHIRDSVKDGYYTVNFRADPSSSMSIIAYETAVDKMRHMCVMGDCSVDYVPMQMVKDAMKK